MAAHPTVEPASEPEPTTAELLDLFGDEYTRQVFEAVAEKPRRGRDVAEAAGVSRPTAYRRLNELHDAGVVRAEMTIDDDGHHCKRFHVVAETLSVSLDGALEATVERTRERGAEPTAGGGAN